MWRRIRLLINIVALSSLLSHFSVMAQGYREQLQVIETTASQNLPDAVAKLAELGEQLDAMDETELGIYFMVASDLAVVHHDETLVLGLLAEAEKVLPNPSAARQYWLQLLEFKYRLLMDNVREHIKSLQSLESAIKQQDSTYLQAYYYTSLQVGLFESNVLDLALDAAIKAQHLWTELGNDYRALTAQYQVASLKMYLGDLTSASQELDQALAKAQLLQAKYSQIGIELKMATLLDMQGEPQLALAKLSEIREQYDIAIGHPYYWALMSQKVQINARLGRNEQVLATTELMLSHDAQSYFADRNLMQLLRAAAMVRLGQTTDVAANLNSILAEYQRVGDNLGRFETLLVQAELDYANQDIVSLFNRLQALVTLIRNYSDQQGAKRTDRVEQAVESEQYAQQAAELSETNVENLITLNNQKQSIDHKNSQLFLLTVLLCALIIVFIWLAYALRRIRVLANTDSLTGIANRRNGIETAQQLLKRARKQQQSIAIAIMDLDKFKTINDTFGHASGDEVLRQSTQTTLRVLAGDGLFCRMGGEEFMLVLVNQSEQASLAVFERIRTQLKDIDFSASNMQQYRVSASIGVCYSVKHNDAGCDSCARDQSVDDNYEQHDEKHQVSLDQMIAIADQALYRAKEAGRDTVCLLPVTETGS
ncbi:diguanylate cyclase [Shewanella waksmanii]|uniref:GGDEF domain-containing protein n=1 Tax=Shewanella waksmanii TaxID=213783 RepID=UPI0037350198